MELEEKIFSGYTILLKWKGENTAPINPILLMAHMDVVPPGDLDKWKEAPFSGLIKKDLIASSTGSSSILNFLDESILSKSISNDFIS